MNQSSIIRIKPETKQFLDNIKVFDRESYDKVIKRMIQNMFEDYLELNKQTKELILNRIGNVKKGKVMSTEQLFTKLFKNGMIDGI